MKLFLYPLLLLPLLFMIACQGGKEERTVDMMMWQGDPLINDYMQHYIKPQVKERHGINLNLINGQGRVIVSTLMTEKEAGKEKSELDLLWINGETFYQLRQIDGLHGPFLDSLSHARYLDLENPFIKYDFQQEIDGYEAPWGSVQMALIYNTEKVEQPPMNPAELRSWLMAHPGRFTLSNDFTGISFLKLLLIHFAGGQEAISGSFDEELYQRASDSLWTYLSSVQPYFWREGKTFPEGLAAMHRLFASGELSFTMSMNDNEVENKVEEGIFLKTSRAYVWDIGTIKNSHYLGIPSNSPHKDLAMKVIDFMLSPEAQLKKLNPKVWGDGTVLAVDKLSPEWQKKFNNIPERDYAPPRDKMAQKALMEPAPEYMLRLYEEFQTKVIEGR